MKRIVRLFVAALLLAFIALSIWCQSRQIERGEDPDGVRRRPAFNFQNSEEL